MSKMIGFIGVGLMGHGMAKNLLNKGYDVTAMAHRNREPLEDLLSKGGKEASTPKEIAEVSDIIIICVTGSPQVEAVIYGENGVLAGCRKGQIVIESTSSEPSMTERIAASLAEKGVAVADSPLARTPIEAEEGRLNTMVGASEDTFAAIKPILECYCENIFHVGDVGSGHKAKLINNFMAMGQGALIAEALCACAAVGVDIRKYYEVVSAGGANSGIFQLIVPKAMDEGHFDGLKFSLANAEKDLRYYTQMTDGASLSGELGKAVHASLADGLEQGFGDGYVGDMLNSQAKRNNIKIF